MITKFDSSYVSSVNLEDTSYRAWLDQRPVVI